MNASGMTEEKAKGANMPLVFGLTFVFSIFIANGASILFLQMNPDLMILIQKSANSFQDSWINTETISAHLSMVPCMEPLAVFF
jgi:hypothetical protein